MFYKVDVLTRKRNGFGVIWLAGTLGPKAKRLSKKEIISVQIPEACEHVMHPPEPLALRLSSSLLVGVSRIYGQQYTIHYNEVHHLIMRIRQALATYKTQQQFVDLIQPRADVDAITLQEEFDVTLHPTYLTPPVTPPIALAEELYAEPRLEESILSTELGRPVVTPLRAPPTGVMRTPSTVGLSARAERRSMGPGYAASLASTSLLGAEYDVYGHLTESMLDMGLEGIMDLGLVPEVAPQPLPALPPIPPSPVAPPAPFEVPYEIGAPLPPPPPPVLPAVPPSPVPVYHVPPPPLPAFEIPEAAVPPAAAEELEAVPVAPAAARRRRRPALFDVEIAFPVRTLAPEGANIVRLNEEGRSRAAKRQRTAAAAQFLKHIAQPLLADLEPDLAEAMRTARGPVVAPPPPEEAEVPPPEFAELELPPPPPVPEMEVEVPLPPAPPAPPVPPSPLAPEAARLAEIPEYEQFVGLEEELLETEATFAPALPWTVPPRGVTPIRAPEVPGLEFGVSPILPPQIPEPMTPSITEVETIPPLRLPSEELVPFPEVPERPAAPPAEYMSLVEQESQHFLGFMDSLMDAAGTSTLLFDDVVAAAGHTRRAAAEGLFHVLALTSRGIMRVAQDEPYGSIQIERLH
ncbi:hypothetical protein AMAG_01934 [Allomyces macrogynus ATCC 38327]|uniref:Rad21/Rec8-like protein N-terminal domain-containing protein n=1 Tax=Allomyces macrogynus (strain ATCC 38327) TaxID=578462 RepID=A0A0L0S0D9_ALLM3|nr:hypothetical protein AMAG_01934 [Allomyces macrogynus ATCC 38327]|eukprot:KNE56092.1 hypothetical protein AMAG_01934 [Allomyces macrogynus ATCC 38327]